jgi:hypothetical protein
MNWIVALLVVLVWLLARDSMRNWVRGLTREHWLLESWVWFVVVLVLFPEILVETVADYLKGRA